MDQVQPQVQQKLGIENLRKVLKVAIDVGNVADEVGRDTSSGRWMRMTPLFQDVISLGKVDFKQVMPELKDLDDAERAQLIEDVKQGVKLGDKDLEFVLEEGISIINDMTNLVIRSMRLAGRLKGHDAVAPIA